MRKISLTTILSILLIVTAVMSMISTYNLNKVEDQNAELIKENKQLVELVLEYEGHSTEMKELVDGYKTYIEDLKAQHQDIQERLVETMPK